MIKITKRKNVGQTVHVAGCPVCGASASERVLTDSSSGDDKEYPP